MKNTIYLLAIVSVFSSCKKFLDVEPKTEILNDKVITSSKDLLPVLYGAYDGLQSGNVYGGNYIMFADLLADDTDVIEASLSNFGNKEIYLRATTTQIGFLRGAWADGYSVINRANTVIYYIDNKLVNDDNFELIKDDYKGQALFLRAITHFQMLNFWSLPYDVNNIGGNSQLGIPYRTEPTLNKDQDLNMARSSVEKNYESIIKDLTEAYQLIKEETHISNASKMAAAAFLARVYFFKGQYDSASTWANVVINSNNYSLEDRKLLINNYQNQGNQLSKEMIFQLVNIDEDQSNSLPGYYTRYNNSGLLFRSNYNFYRTHENIYDTLTYSDGTSKILNDSRADTLYVNYNFSKTTYISKWDRNPETYTANNIPVIRLAEMHLIRAEANYLAGISESEAQESYKIVRQRSVGEAIFEAEGEPVWSDDDFLVKIRAERRRELAFEGDRYLNLRRLKLPMRDGVAYNDPSLLFKIPQEEMSGNTLMVQNP